MHQKGAMARDRSSFMKAIPPFMRAAVVPRAALSVQRSNVSPRPMFQDGRHARKADGRRETPARALSRQRHSSGLLGRLANRSPEFWFELVIGSLTLASNLSRPNQLCPLPYTTRRTSNLRFVRAQAAKKAPAFHAGARCSLTPVRARGDRSFPLLALWRLFSRRPRFVAGQPGNLARILCGSTGLVPCGSTGLVAGILSLYGWTGLVPWHALNAGSTIWRSGGLRYSRRCSNQSGGNNQRSHSPHKFCPHKFSS